MTAAGRMCPKHAVAWTKWATHGSPSQPFAPPPVEFVQIGQVTAQSLREDRRRRAEDHYALIRAQCTMIRRFCAEGRNCGYLPTACATGGQT